MYIRMIHTYIDTHTHTHTYRKIESMDSSEFTDSRINTARLNALGVKAGSIIKKKIHTARRNAVCVNAGKKSQEYSVW